MGVYAGPDVSESGLVLALDAGNNRSYSRNRFLCPGTSGQGASADNNVTFALNGTGTFVRMGHGQTVGNYTIKPTDVVYRYAMGETGCLYHGNKITVPQGSYLNFSFDYLVTGATTYPIADYLANIEDYSSGGLGNGIGVANSIQGIWQRRVMYSGPAATTVTDCNVLLYPGACSNTRLADSGTIYYRNPRAEIINYDPDPNSRGFDSGFSYATNINLVNDISGLGNNGTFANTGNAPLYSSANGGSWVFDGVDDRIECGTWSVPYITVSNWVYKTSSATNQGICRKQTGWAVSQYNGTLQVAPGTSWTFYNTGYTIPLNTWVNIVYTYSGTGTTGSQTVYINGSNIYNTSAGSGAISANSNPVRIGYDDNNWFWGGRIAQTQIYNRALTAAEVQQNFNATRGRYGI